MTLARTKRIIVDTLRGTIDVREAINSLLERPDEEDVKLDFEEMAARIEAIASDVMEIVGLSEDDAEGDHPLFSAVQRLREMNPESLEGLPEAVHKFNKSVQELLVTQEGNDVSLALMHASSRLVKEAESLYSEVNPDYEPNYEVPSSPVENPQPEQEPRNGVDQVQEDERIQAFRGLVKSGVPGQVAGVPVDVKSANAVVRVYDALGAENQQKFLTYPPVKMVELAWKLIAKKKEKSEQPDYVNPVPKDKRHLHAPPLENTITLGTPLTEASRQDLDKYIKTMDKTQTGLMGLRDNLDEMMDKMPSGSISLQHMRFGRDYIDNAGRTLDQGRIEIEKAQRVTEGEDPWLDQEGAPELVGRDPFEPDNVRKDEEDYLEPATFGETELRCPNCASIQEGLGYLRRGFVICKSCKLEISEDVIQKALDLKGTVAKSNFTPHDDSYDIGKDKFTKAGKKTLNKTESERPPRGSIGSPLNLSGPKIWRTKSGKFATRTPAGKIVYADSAMLAFQAARTRNKKKKESSPKEIDPEVMEMARQVMSSVAEDLRETQEMGRLVREVEEQFHPGENPEPESEPVEVPEEPEEAMEQGHSRLAWESHFPSGTRVLTPAGEGIIVVGLKGEGDSEIYKVKIDPGGREVAIRAGDMKIIQTDAGQSEELGAPPEKDPLKITFQSPELASGYVEKAAELALAVILGEDSVVSVTSTGVFERITAKSLAQDFGGVFT